MPQSADPKLDFNNLPEDFPRQFVPRTIDFNQSNSVKEIYESLIMRTVTSVREFEQWILDRSELEAAIDQHGSILYIRMTCKTDDQKFSKDYETFITTIIPVIKPLNHELNQRFLDLAARFPVDDGRYEVYIRDLKAEVDLFIPENIPLQTEVDLLSQEYQKICGAMTVEFDGKEQTMPQMSKYLLERDRPIREKAWRAVADRRLKDKQTLDDLFDKMLRLRNRIAVNAGCKNFCEYKFRSLCRFDYTPKDCKTYHDTVERIVLPLWKEILEKRKKQLGLKSLRPWDTEVDPEGKPPLKPFDQVDDLVEKCGEIFKRVDPEFGAQFTQMRQLGLLDLASRKGKAPGGYQTTLYESRKPFIFMNAVGLDSDVRTLLHEGGHAFHSLACSHDPLVAYRHGPMEFNEVASMGMELLADEHLGVIYTDEDFVRSRQAHLEDVIYILIWVATVDAFQHWIYENPEHSQQERREFWMKNRQRFGAGLVDWSELEEVHSSLWQRQLHIFEVPFYYIEYGIAQLGALQLWNNYRKDKRSSLKNFRAGLRLGGSRPLPEIYQKAGIVFDFSERTIAPLMKAVSEELRSLGS